MLLCYLYLTERRCNEYKTKNAKECGMESRMNRGWMKKSFLPVAAGMVLLTACGAETPGAEIIQSSESIEAGTSAGESTENVSDSQKQPLTEKEKRDEKEWEQLLDYTAERQAELAEIVVDLSEESEEIQAMGQNVLKALTEGQTGLALEMVTSSEWMETMLPGLLIGQRNYTWEEGSESGSITVISDELGQAYTKIFTAPGNVLEVTADQIRLTNCEETAQAAGNFVCESMELQSGSYRKVEGSFAEGGVLQGILQVSVASLDLSGGIASGWDRRGEELTVYEGEFDEAGHTLVETPKQLKDAGKTAYAVKKENKSGLYLTVDGAEDMIFTADLLGVDLW